MREPPESEVSFGQGDFPTRLAPLRAGFSKEVFMTRATAAILACCLLLAGALGTALANPAHAGRHHHDRGHGRSRSHTRHHGHTHARPGRHHHVSARTLCAHTRNAYCHARTLRREIRRVHVAVARVEQHPPAQLHLHWSPTRLRRQLAHWRHHLVHARHVAAHHRAVLRQAAQHEARAVSIARTYLGVPYVWGGSSYSGTDCSGLTMAVYARLGVHLNHYTGSQWYAGQHVPRDDLRPGDLVFFDGSAAPGHVGIYAGGGEFIHAPHSGTVVQYSSLSNEPGYVGAVRPHLS